jgi:hypothetical protein
VPFTAYNIDKSESAKRQFDRVQSEGLIPYAIINGHELTGFSTASYAQALDSARQGRRGQK